MRLSPSLLEKKAMVKEFQFITSKELTKQPLLKNEIRPQNVQVLFPSPFDTPEMRMLQRVQVAGPQGHGELVFF